MVGHGCRLAATVHGKHAIAHINTAQRDGRGKDIAESRTASHIAMINKTLTRHASLTAEFGKDSGTDGIAGILLSKD